MVYFKCQCKSVLPEVNVGLHYIVITYFERNKKDRTITLKYVSYGKEESKTITYDQFKEGMQGYWIPENNKNAGGTEKNNINANNSY